ncbi:MAG: DNA polymerase III subunit beta [Hyphomicrobiales bacterium]|nr:DNA polymerase III subunit beta [Hyphomicrobiales bacterium]
MRLTIEKKELERLLKAACGVAERRAVIPILGHVLITAGAGAVSVVATDMDMTVRAAGPADVEAQGQATAPAHVLADIVRKLPAGRVSVELQKTELAVASGRSRFRLAALDPADFPAMTEPQAHAIALPGAELRRCLTTARAAISSDPTRPYLHGVHVHGGDGRIHFVATDGHRLHAASASLSPDAPPFPAVTILKKAASMMLAMADGEEACALTLGDNKMAFAAGGASLVAKLVEGKFPEYGRIVPPPVALPVRVNAALLAAKLDLAATVHMAGAETVNIEAAGEGLSLLARDKLHGASLVDLDAHAPDAAITIGFNESYLREMLAPFGDAEVEVHLSAPEAAVLVRRDGDDGFYAVGMPCRMLEPGVEFAAFRAAETAEAA